MSEEYDLRQEKMDEFRQDCLVENKIRNDIEYFKETSGTYEQLVDILARMKGLCGIYDHDFDDILDMAKDEI